MKKLFLIGLLLVSGFVMAQAQTEEMLLPVKINGKWGYINTGGKIVVDAVYDYTEAFEMKRFAKVLKDGAVKIIDRKGNVLQGLKFDDMQVIDDSTLAIQKEKKWGAATIDGKILVEPIYEKVSRSNTNNAFLYKQDDKNGLVGRDGKILVPAQYDSVYALGDFYIAKAFSGLSIYANGAEIHAADSLNFVSLYTNNILFYVTDTLWGAVNTIGEKLVAPEWHSFIRINDAFVTLIKNGKEVLYSLNNKKIIADSTYSDFNIFNEEDGSFLVNTADGTGLIDATGKLILKPLYDNIFEAGNFLLFSKDRKTGFATKLGKVIVPPKYDYMQPFDEDFNNVTLVSRNDKWGVVNGRGTEIVPVNYTSVKLFADAARAQKGKSIWMFDIDENGNLTGKDEYTNVMRIAVTNRRKSIQSDNIVVNNGKGGWFLAKENLKWGYRDTAGKVLVKPVYDKIVRHPELGLTLLYRQHPNNVNIWLGNNRLTYRHTLGLFDDTLQKVIVQPVYTSINLSNWQFRRAEYITAITSQGEYVLLYRSGLANKTRYAFVDETTGKLTRVAYKGKLVIAYPERDEKTVCTFLDYIRRLDGVSYVLNKNRPLGKEPQVIASGAKWGYIDNEGRAYIAPVYDFVLPFANGKAITVKENNWGVIDTEQHEIIPFQYHYIFYLHESNTGYFQLALNNEKYGLVSLDGTEKVTPMYKKLGNVNDGLLWMKTGNKYTFISTNGDTITDNKMRKVRNYSDGMAAVLTKSGAWNYLNEKGELAFTDCFRNCGDFHNGLAWVLKNNKRGYISKDGKMLIAPKYQATGDFNEQGLAIVGNRRGKFGIINTKGKKVKRCRFEEIHSYSEGIAIAKTKHRFVLINEKGKRIKSLSKYYEIEPFSEGFAAVRTLAKNGKIGYGFIDKNGKEVIPTQYKTCYKFSNGVCVVGEKNSRNKFVITLAGDSLFDQAYNIIGDFSEGFAVVKKPNNAYYFIDKEGKNHFNRSFSMAKPFENGYAKVIIDKKWGLIDTNGITIVSPKYDDMGAISDGMVTVKLNYFYGVADSTGKLIAPADFSAIRFLPKLNIFQVESGNTIGYLRTDGSWLWDMKE